MYMTDKIRYHMTDAHAPLIGLHDIELDEQQKHHSDDKLNEKAPSMRRRWRRQELAQGSEYYVIARHLQ
jgi:hypothetical protein